MTSKLTPTQLQFSDADDNVATISHSSGNISVNGANLTNLGSPTLSHHAVHKEYVDSVASGLDVKVSVRVATTEAGTLTTSFTAGATIDGVTIAVDDRILIKNQADASENGIYLCVEEGAPTRATDFDEDAEVTSGAFTFVEEGTANGSNGYVLTSNGSIEIGVTALTFSQFSASSAGATTLADLSDVLVEDNSLYIGNDPSSTTSTAQYNVAVGTTALESVITGDNNVAMGYQAGAAITDAKNNTFLGYRAGALIAAGHAGNGLSDNVVIGAGAASQADGLLRSVVMGFQAGFLARAGYNTLIGYQAGNSVTTGHSNTVIGTSAGDSLTTGHSNTVIGMNADTHSATGSNQTVIGYGATGVGDNSVTLGDSNVQNVYCGSGDTDVDAGSAAVLHAGSIRVADGQGIGSASKTDAITITSGGVVNISSSTASSSATTGALTVAGGAGIAADLSVGDDLRLSSDSAVLSFGADEDVTLTHVPDTGLLLNANMQLQFRDSAIHISSDNDHHLNIQASDQISLNIDGSDKVTIDAGDVDLKTNLKVSHDGSRIQFGSDADISMSHEHDVGLEFLNSQAGMEVTLAGGYAAVEAGDSIAAIHFRAPDVDVGGEADAGGDADSSPAAREVCASLEAVAEATFNANHNASRLVFKTASGGTPTAKMLLKSNGDLSLTDGDLCMEDDEAKLKFGSNGDVTISYQSSEEDTESKIVVNAPIHASTFNATSDARLKADVVEIADAVSKVKRIRGVDFVWKETGKADTGVIAQEVEQVLPHVVSGVDEETRAVDYGRITALLIQAVKEQQDQIDELKAIIAKQ